MERQTTAIILHRTELAEMFGYSPNTCTYDVVRGVNSREKSLNVKRVGNGWYSVDARFKLDPVL